MIQAEIRDGHVHIEVDCRRRPAIYLDQFALHHFASREAPNTRFLEAFKTRGELLFSAGNTLEIATTDGLNALQVVGFLHRIGPHWVPIESDPFKVTIEMAGRSHGPHPILDGDLLNFVYELSPGPPDTLTLGGAMLAFHGYPEEKAFYRETMRKAKQRVADKVAEMRAAYRADPAAAADRYTVIQDRGKVMHIASAVMRAIAIDEAKSYAWSLNDATDLLHAMVPIAVADAVFLDKAWKNRLARLDLPMRLPRIYYGPQADEFLDWLESVPIPYEDNRGGEA